LILLIEPSAGLHPADVAELLECFDRLLSAGHSIIAIENDMDVIRGSDYVIDLERAAVVAHGTPEEIAQVAESSTGNLLKAALTA